MPYDDLSPKNSNLIDAVAGLSDVSIYQGVNRELFSGKVALTSAALRERTMDRGFNDPTGDLGGLSSRSALTWGVAATMGTLAGISALRACILRSNGKANGATIKTLLGDALKSGSELRTSTLERSWYVKPGMTDEQLKLALANKDYWSQPWAFREVCGTIKSSYDDLEKIDLGANALRIKTAYAWDSATKSVSQKALVYIDKGRVPFIKSEVYAAYNTYDEFADLAKKRHTTIENLVQNEDNLAMLQKIDDVNARLEKDTRLQGELNDILLGSGGSTDVSNHLSKDLQSFKETYADALQTSEQLQDQIDVANKSAPRWSKAAFAFGVATFILTVISVVSTAYDLYKYYNVDYAPIPKYIVDAADITQTTDDGTLLMVRNDVAYYEVARTNRSKDGGENEALRDYADLNGDAGKEWLALYCARRDDQLPVLADSLRVVVGSSAIPEGYSSGIHAFGSDSAANLTDARYCYNDDAGGVYAYFRRDEGAASVAGSSFGGGSAALWAGAGLAVGAAAGAGVTTAVGRRRRGGA